MLPGTLWAEDYWGYDGKPARSWVAFGQHFAATVGVDLLPDGPMPWGLRAWHFYTDRLLPDADGVADVVLHHPRMYGRFLVASVREGIPSVGVAFGPLVAVAGAVVASWRRLPEVAKITLVAFAVGVAPHWLVTYPTARHLARWYPLAVVAAVWLWSRAEGRERLMLGGLIVMSGVWSAGLLSV